MITDFYDKVVIKIEYEGFYGSGILISNTQKTNSYLITAWHCLNEQTDIAYEKIKIFRQVEGCIKEIFLNFREKTILKENDIIIFTIDFLDDIPEYQIIEPEIREKVAIVGFPNALSSVSSNIKRYLLRGEAWLLYLIIRCIEDRENLKNENYYMIKGIDGDRSVKVFYVTNHTKLPDFLKDYLQNAYFDINDGELMIIKTDKTPAKKILPSSKINEIVTNISRTISVENHLYIDDVKSSMQHKKQYTTEMEKTTRLQEIITSWESMVDSAESICKNLVVSYLEKGVRWYKFVGFY